jgi:alpha-tubulin suppressor-like RCC1 family protein
VFSWGWGLQGQLGLGHNNTVLRPNKVELPTKIVSIAAGGIHSGCIDVDGVCYTWGSSEYGQLGRPITGAIDNKPGIVLLESSNEPLLVKKLALGGMHSAAIDFEGMLWCWGRADSGQTGSGRWVYASFPGIVFPRKTPGIEDVRDVSCGGFHTVVVTAEGRALSMGKSDFGVLGTGLGTPGKMESEMLTEIAALSGHHIVGVSCGGWHTMLWTSEGELFACGKGEYGRMGVGNEKPIPTPKHVKMPESAKVVYVSSGGSHSLILTSSGQVFVSGRSDDYRLALMNVGDENHKVLSPVPVTIDWNLYLTPNKRNLLGVSKATDSLVVKQLAAGGAHTLILTDLASV